jgi:hypothetical protein
LFSDTFARAMFIPSSHAERGFVHRLRNLERVSRAQRGAPVRPSSAPPAARSSPAIFDNNVLALNVAHFIEALPKGSRTVTAGLRRAAVDQPDHRHRRLLRMCLTRPRSRRTAEERDELAPS